MSARAFIVFLALAGLACSGSAPARDELSKCDCDEQQGIWIDARYGDEQTGYCVTPTTDRGRRCQSKSDCQSACVTDDKVESGHDATGQCFGWSNLIGHCVNLVDDDGMAEGTICYD